MKTNVYVDGFNLYYGCLRGTPYRWLDLAALCRQLLPTDTINRIRYFTAHITSRPADPHKRLRQQVYLRALETIPNLSIHYGHYLSYPTRMPLEPPPVSGPRTAQVLRTEEKGSDVNLATFLLVDAFDQDYEAAVVISNDSDLLLPIETARARFGVTVGVLNPHKTPSMALKRAASFSRQIHPGALRASQFPPTLTDARGRTITKPASW